MKIELSKEEINKICVNHLKNLFPGFEVTGEVDFGYKANGNFELKEIPNNTKEE